MSSLGSEMDANSPALIAGAVGHAQTQHRAGGSSNNICALHSGDLFRSAYGNRVFGAAHASYLISNGIVSIAPRLADKLQVAAGLAECRENMVVDNSEIVRNANAYGGSGARQRQ